jgi:hypothetical protein
MPLIAAWADSSFEKTVVVVSLSVGGSMVTNFLQEVMPNVNKPRKP